jgi:O-antigen/teichoic acid export membrane protein
MAKDGVAGEGSARILVNSGFRAIADIGGKLATAALFIVLARSVGAAEYGIWTFAFSFAILLTIPGSIGQDIVLTREVARDQDRLDDFFADALMSRVVLNLPVLAIALVTASLAGMSTETRLVVLLLGLGCILDGLLHLVFAVFQAFERLGAVPVILMTQRWGTTLGALLALALGQGVAVVAGLYAACAVVALVLGLVLISRLLVRPRFRVSRLGWARLVREAAPIGIASVSFYVLLRIDTAMLALFQPAADVGMYGAAYRLLETTMFVSWSVNAAVLPVLSRLSPSSEPTDGFVYGRALKLVIALTLPVAVGAAVLAGPLVELLYGAEYAPAATALLLLAPAIVLYPVSMLSSSLLYAQGQSKIVAYVYLGVLAENIALNLVLLPSHSFRGAALGTSISEALVAGILLVASAGLHGRLPVARLVVGTALGSAVAGAVMYASRDMLPAALVLGPATYVCVLLAVERVAFPDDFATLASFLDRVRARGGRAGRAGPPRPTPAGPATRG